MLDDRLLERFIDRFYGYGNYDAKYWFVGMEEGIKKSEDTEKSEKKIAKKLKLWNKRGRKELEDLVDFHCALGPNKHFDERAVLVKTWNRIIHVLFGIEGKKHKRAQVKDYQRSQLAREKNGDSCLMELLPLPSPNVNAWPPYYKSSRIPYLKSRDDYEAHVRPERVNHLKSKIEEYRPKAVVFYGKRNWKHYREIASVKFQSTEIDGVKMGSNERTLFIMTKHPALFEARNREFYEVGRMIARRLVRLAR